MRKVQRDPDPAIRLGPSPTPGRAWYTVRYPQGMNCALCERQLRAGEVVLGYVNDQWALVVHCKGPCPPKGATDGT